MSEVDVEALDRWGIGLHFLDRVETSEIFETELFWRASAEFFVKFVDDNEVGAYDGSIPAALDRYFDSWKFITGLDSEDAFILMVMPAKEDFTALEVAPLVKLMDFDELVTQIFARLPLELISTVVESHVDGDLLRSLLKGAS
jgi:hypothetical protein